MGNRFLKTQSERDKSMRNYGALIGQQFDVDMMCLALSDEGFGYDRIMRVLTRAEEYRGYYKDCLNYTVESDARFVQLDNALLKICHNHPDRFIPYTERYPGVMVPTMEKKFKADPIGGKHV